MDFKYEGCANFLVKRHKDVLAICSCIADYFDSIVSQSVRFKNYLYYTINGNKNYKICLLTEEINEIKSTNKLFMLNNQVFFIRDDGFYF